MQKSIIFTEDLLVWFAAMILQEAELSNVLFCRAQSADAHMI